ncbi:pullulanase-associated domain-containing protein, partial [Reinekea sp.]|uniref:pullulanase-associated domain-containing protein n=1 Tax=Reinekea sp. TaxID=1970455 RepID=UPI002A81C707
MNIRVITAVKLLVILFTVNLTACIPDPANALIEIEPHQAIVYYQRDADDYDGWGLHLWDDIGAVTDEVATATSWSAPLQATGVHPLYGAYYIIDLRTDDWADFKFIMHKGDSKDLGGADHLFDRATLSQDVFTFQGVGELFPEPLLEAPVLLSGASAHFIEVADAGSASLVYKTRSAANSVALWHSPSAALVFNAESKTVSGGTSIAISAAAMSPAQIAAYPHLANFDGYWLDASTEEAKNLVKDQLWVVESNAANEVVRLTRVQTAPLLDALYYEAAKDATLGAFNNAGHTQFSLWAPTAQEVSVKVYDSQFTLLKTVPMREDNET